MDKKLTLQIKKYLETSKQQRDHAAGAEMLLRLSRNQIVYARIMRAPAKYADFLEHELQKFYNVRVVDLTHQELAAMEQEAYRIVGPLLNQKPTEAQELRAGKRGDHDALPPEIKALYERQPEIRARIRAVQAKLVMLSEDPTVCKDSDRLPFVKELRDLAKEYYRNWDRYDHYSGADSMPVATIEAAKKRSRSALGSINLNKKKYAALPTPELRDKIRGWYADVIRPTEKLTNELRMLGIID